MSCLAQRNSFGCVMFSVVYVDCFLPFEQLLYDVMLGCFTLKACLAFFLAIDPDPYVCLKRFFYASAAIVPNIIPLFRYASHYVLSCMINYNQKILQVNINNNDNYYDYYACSLGRTSRGSRAIQYYRTNTVLIRDH
jgi:hypothetical protein